MIKVVCDICKRTCQDHSTIEAVNEIPPLPTGNTLHICHARDGGDVGCIAFYKAGIERARELANEALRERAPYLFEADGSRKAYL